MRASSGDDEAVHLMRTATAIQKEIFDKELSFDSSCQENSVPASLLALVHMLLEGTNIIEAEAFETTSATESIAQLIVFIVQRC